MSGGREGWMQWREMARGSEACLQEDKADEKIEG